MGMGSPLGSTKHWAMKSKEYRPIWAASSMIGQGVSSRSSHSWAGGPDHVLREVVDPLLDLQLVLVEVQREIGHGALLRSGPGACPHAWSPAIGTAAVTARPCRPAVFVVTQ